MAAAMTDERRKHSRVAFSTAIKIRVKTDDTSIEVSGDSRDLSLKGLFVSGKDRFVIDTKCDIMVILSSGSESIKLQMKGRVARVTENGMGIIFDSMDVDSYSHLKNIVKYNSESHEG